MYEEFKQMTDEQLLAIVNLKTGHYTHDELQAAREEFIRRMYSEPLIPPREEIKEEPEKEEIQSDFYEDLRLTEPVKLEPEDEISMQEKLTEQQMQTLKEETFEPTFEPYSKESFDEIKEFKEEPQEESTKTSKDEYVPDYHEKTSGDLAATRTFTPAETMVLEQKADEQIFEQEAEQMGFFEEEKPVFEEFVSRLTEEDYDFYERPRPRTYCSSDTKLNKFCRRVVMPVVCAKTFITLLIALFAVITDHQSLMFNLYTCSAFIILIAEVFAWDALVNDINPIIPKLVLSCELLLALTDLFGGTYIVPVILVWIYIALVIMGLIGLFPSKKAY